MMKSLYPSLSEARKAAQRLGVTTWGEYNKRYKEDPCLPSCPNKVYAEEWTGASNFFGKESPFYPTLAEARTAVQRLGITTKLEYQKYYKKDPYLPSNPNRIYAKEWLGFLDFIGKESRLYPTLAEARAAVQRLGITTWNEYNKRYKEDPRLPSSPNAIYAREWLGFLDFIGKESGFYPTLAEARAAVQRLGITTWNEYNKRYKEDPKLPSHPDATYATWAGALDFFVKESPFYPTLAEARTAVQRLGVTTWSEYRKRYKEDPRLPSCPDAIYATWAGALDFFVKESPFYPTLAEARAAVQRLGITTLSEYKKRYEEDPCLPSSPNIIYASEWLGFSDLFVKESPFYSTLAEARAAVQRLGITTWGEYNKRYKEDLYLPSSPNRIYAEEWTGGSNFFDKESPFYPTLAEARAAVQRLGITAWSEYKKRYKEDPCLPSCPNVIYAREWLGFSDLFVKESPFYSTLAAACTAVQRLGITTLSEYKRRYKEDPCLPYLPDKVFAEEWISYQNFLGVNDDPFSCAFSVFKKACPEWKLAVEKYITESRSQSTKITHLRAFLTEVVVPSNFTKSPSDLLNIDFPFPKKIYEAYVNNTGPTGKKVRHNICLYFFDWLLDHYCSEENVYGERIRLPGFRNPLVTLMGHLAELIQHCRPSESVKPVLPMSVIVRARNCLIPNGCHYFSDLFGLHTFLNDAWFVVDPSIIDLNDRDCVWRNSVLDRKRGDIRYRERVTQVWSPVKLVALYTLLMTPLRGQQICWLDSGEADEEIPVLDGLGIKWVKNTSHIRRSGRQQGFLKRYPENQLGMFITTNKTGSSNSGYAVPYIVDELAYWVIRLREWQSKYNPLSELTKWTQIKLRQRINKDILKVRGNQAFLFRDPCGGDISRKSPIQSTTAFSQSLPALLASIQSPNEELVEYQPEKKSFVSPFTPHCLRTSMITAFIVDGGAPPAVVMKLVGHATLVMTLYYAKVGPSKMRAELAEAEKRALQENVDRLSDLAFTKEIESAKPHLIAMDRDFMDKIDASWPLAAYQFMDWGICPMSGQGCDKGGQLIIHRQFESIYAPVEAGYLGRRNCPRCRFFITGPAWLGGLQALVNEIILEINSVRHEYHDLVEKQRKLEDDKYDAESEGKEFGNFSELNQTTAALEERAHKLDMFVTDFQHVYRLIQQCVELLNQGEKCESSNKNQLIICEQGAIDFALEESRSEFRLLSSICCDAEIYQASSSSRAVPKLAQMIDAFVEKNGFAPGLFKLSEAQQRNAANQISRLLLKRLNDDWNLAERLVIGEIGLSDLDSEEALTPLREDIARALRDEESTFKKLGVLK
ncbi:VPA1269 family protein [Hahella aquimaris]|uniref:gamma-mobile-trio integrase GmtZ n=1 Tax=Hahella sp. HNIBRBA332 TaxID=3015983 RepID=UPI00273C1BA5|nr:VPA1269 family protein [Hahella sp. HNIBRBA332]WLQ16821.1 VPA1269 family protein [Hahella sp. HNIBRBA332]